MIRVFFLLFSISLFSQKMTLSDRVVAYKDSIYVYGPNYYFKSHKSSPSDFKEYPLVLQDSIFANSHIITALDKGIFMLDPMGGGVWAFSNDSIKRLDRSFKHRMQIDATVISRKDTIFKYGGYGFWSMRNFFTFYDFESREWEMYPPINSDEIPKGTAGSFHIQKGDEVLIFGGKSLNEKDLIDQYSNQDIWRFNFKTKDWKFIGKAYEDYNTFKMAIPFEDKIAFFGDTEIQVVSPHQNSVKYYAQNSLHLKLIKSNKVTSFYKDGVFYCFTYSSNTEQLNLVTRNIDEFFGPELREDKMYASYSPMWNALYLIFLLPIGYIFKKVKALKLQKNKISIQGSGVTHKNIFYALNEIELSILKLLLKEGSVDTSKILSIVENPDHNYSHNMRTKNKVVGELHYKIKTILKTEEEIVSIQKSSKDKRILIYSINTRFFN